MRHLRNPFCAVCLAATTACSPVALAPVTLSPNPVMLGVPRDIHGNVLSLEAPLSSYALETSALATSTSSTQQVGQYDVTTTTSTWNYASSDPDMVVLANSGGRADTVFVQRPTCSAFVLLTIGGGIGGKSCTVEGKAFGGRAAAVIPPREVGPPVARAKPVAAVPAVPAVPAAANEPRPGATPPAAARPTRDVVSTKAGRKLRGKVLVEAVLYAK
jgi:hypothetical protein